MPEYQNIKVTPSVFERLKRNKPDGVTWSRYLDQLQEQSEQYERIKDNRL